MRLLTVATAEDPRALLINVPNRFINPYDTARLPPVSHAEEREFRAGTEDSLPPEIVAVSDWLDVNRLRAWFHRKMLTIGCEQAIRERSRVLGMSLTPKDELKTMVFDLLGNNGQTARLAVHLEGDAMLPANSDGTVSKELLLALFNRLTGGRFTRLRASRDVVTGRQNPVSFLLDHPDGVQFFSSGLRERRRRFTNAGLNTWGVLYPDFSEVLATLIRRTPVYLL